MRARFLVTAGVMSLLCFSSCTSDGQRPGDAVASRPEVVDEDTAASRACEALKHTLRSNDDAQKLAARRLVLDCDPSAPDPACRDLLVESAPFDEKVAAFVEAHDPARKAETYDFTRVENWDCEHPHPSTSRAIWDKNSRSLREMYARNVDLTTQICDTEYRSLRRHPWMTDALLERLWASGHCAERVAVARRGLGPDWTSMGEPHWLEFVREGGGPWRVWDRYPSEAVDDLVAEVDAWCRAGPACSVLGRCRAKRFGKGHPFSDIVGCVAASDEDCIAADVCEAEGRCQLGEGLDWCVPRSDADCERSTACARLGSCSVQTRQLEGYGAVPSCGAGLDETSGVELIGYTANPHLLADVSFQIEMQRVRGRLVKAFDGFDDEQLAAFAACGVASHGYGPRRRLNFTIVIDDATGKVVGDISASVDPDRPNLGRPLGCAAQVASEWNFPRTGGTDRSDIQLELDIIRDFKRGPSSGIEH